MLCRSYGLFSHFSTAEKNGGWSLGGWSLFWCCLETSLETNLVQCIDQPSACSPSPNGAACPGQALSFPRAFLSLCPPTSRWSAHGERGGRAHTKSGRHRSWHGIQRWTAPAPLSKDQLSSLSCWAAQAWAWLPQKLLVYAEPFRGHLGEIMPSTPFNFQDKQQQLYPHIS